MNLEPAPRLPKWIFFAIDAGLLVTAFIIVFFNDKNPYAPVPLVSAVVCVMLAAVIGLVPFLIDYAADSAEYVQQERGRAEEQVQRLQAAGESLARAAAQIKAVEEAVHKSAHAAETLPYRMQEKLVEFNAALAEKEESEHESVEEELAELRASNSDQLKTAAEKIQKALADWATLEATSRKQLAAAETAATRVQNSASDSAAKFETRLSGLMTALDAKLAKLERATAVVESAPPAPAMLTKPESTHVEAPPPAPTREPASPPLVESVAVVDDKTPKEPSSLAEEVKIKKNRPARKSRPEDTLAAMSEPSASASSEDEPPVHEFTFSHEPAEANRSSAPAESAVSSDGATRLLATAYIGIGNKLFIRGEGPGLSWDKGVPMQFVSIGKWGWATNDAFSPVRCELYKNDETVALTGEVVLDPGKHVEVTALF
jgi:chemotaxis protein histidine kinase CheA